MCTIYDVLLQNSEFTQFCRDICFVVIYALLRGEKFSQELRLVEKKLLISGMCQGRSDSMFLQLLSRVIFQLNCTAEMKRNISLNQELCESMFKLPGKYASMSYNSEMFKCTSKCPKT